MLRFPRPNGEGLGASWLVLALTIMVCAGGLSVWFGLSSPNPVTFRAFEPARILPAATSLRSIAGGTELYDPPASAPTSAVGILLGGDIALGLEPGRILAASGPTALMRGWIALRRTPGVDLGLANLGCVLTDTRVPADGKSIAMRGEPVQGAAALQWAGIDAVSLANDRLLDYGEPGLLDTFKALRSTGIGWAGAGLDDQAAYAPLMLERNGARIALLAFADGRRPAAAISAAGPDTPGAAAVAPQARMLEAIAAARGQADLVIVALHWGDLGGGEVASGQQELGRLIIDAGAHVVWGHQPQAPGPAEVYHGGLILYGVGSLVAHPFAGATREMMVGLVTFDLSAAGEYRPVEIELLPLLNAEGRTTAMPAAEAERFVRQLAERCLPYGSRWQVLPDRLRLELGQ